ncbi:hypothetical protein BS17DRAFT_795105 [Gyrodon lividus]|nr:hypothetical protein BS17DRAFT_795105 [Gyrodon lividus]
MHGQIPPYQYCSVISQFQSFCDHKNIPSHLHISASEQLLCAFAASHAGTLADNTVQTHLAAIEAWHYYNKPWHGGPCLHYILKGITNLAPSFSKRPPQPPITHSMLLLLTNSLDPSDSFDACFAMWSQSCLGEVLQSSLLAKHHGEDVCICQKLGPSGPIATIDNHLNINKIPPNLPLFSFLSTQGWCCLTKKKTPCMLQLPSGIPTIASHSFCIGGTTELLLTRVPPDVVKALGFWSSNAFLHYWCSLEISFLAW